MRCDLRVQGAQETYTMSGGYCVIQGKTGPVICSPPTVTVVKAPAFCNLQYISASTVTVCSLSRPKIPQDQVTSMCILFSALEFRALEFQECSDLNGRIYSY